MSKATRATSACELSYLRHFARAEEPPESSSGGETAWWIDLVDPGLEARARVEATYALRLPGREDLIEVVSSSRVSEVAGSL